MSNSIPSGKSPAPVATPAVRAQVSLGNRRTPAQAHPKENNAAPIRPRKIIGMPRVAVSIAALSPGPPCDQKSVSVPTTRKPAVYPSVCGAMNTAFGMLVHQRSTSAARAFLRGRPEAPCQTGLSTGPFFSLRAATEPHSVQLQFRLRSRNYP